MPVPRYTKATIKTRLLRVFPSKQFEKRVQAVLDSLPKPSVKKK